MSAAVGGLSHNVATYMVSAVFLGLFFAMQSGTLESIVYDTVLEEIGDSGSFEATIGRLRLIESGALVASALAGGLIAEFAPLRVTYLLTVPLLVAACLVLLGFREPRLHKAGEADEPGSLREQVRDTYRVILQPGPAASGDRGDRRRCAADAGHARVRPALAGSARRARRSCTGRTGRG